MANNYNILDQNGISVTVAPPTLGVSMFYENIADTVLRTLVTPAANINGIEVYSIHISSNSGSNQTRVMYKNSAPATMFEGAVLAFAKGIQLSAVGQVQTAYYDSRVRIIPAGYGLYVQSSNATGAQVDIAYTVLP